MATKKDDADSGSTVRLEHLSGVTVVVPASKADRLVSGGQFAKPTSKRRPGNG